MSTRPNVFNGNVVVSAPSTSNREIQAIVWKRSGWILERLDRMSAGSKELPMPESATGDASSYPERQLPFSVEESEQSEQVASESEAEQRRLGTEEPMQSGRLRTAVELAIEKSEQMERERREAESNQAAVEREEERQRQEANRLEQTSAERAAWEAQREVNHQCLDAEELTPRQLERQRTEAELAVEKVKQAAAQREADRRQRDSERARRAALKANLPKGPAAIATVIARLIRLPIALYQEYSLAKERAKQAAAEREAERQRQEAERLERAAAEREAWYAQQEAERQQREARRARQAALKAQQRKREQYWESLGGIQFERELGKTVQG